VRRGAGKAALCCIPVATALWCSPMGIGSGVGVSLHPFPFWLRNGEPVVGAPGLYGYLAGATVGGLGASNTARGTLLRRHQLKGSLMHSGTAASERVSHTGTLLLHFNAYCAHSRVELSV